MLITFHPQRSDKKQVLSKTGDALCINGETFDFADVPEGGMLPATAIKSEFIGGPVTREDGTVRVHILLPHPASAGEACRFPKKFMASKDGAIPLPEQGGK